MKNLNLIILLTILILSTSVFAQEENSKFEQISDGVELVKSNGVTVADKTETAELEEEPGTESVSEENSEEAPKQIKMLETPEKEGNLDDLVIPQSVFSNPEMLTKLLGDDARFVYNSNEKEDPLVVPWIFDEYKAKLLLTKAEKIWKARKSYPQEKWLEALTMVDEITKRYRKTGSFKKANELQAGWQKEYENKFNKRVVVKKNADDDDLLRPFPTDIKKGMTAIMAAGANSKVIIKEKIYSIGEVIDGTYGPDGKPWFDTVTIKSIEKLEGSRDSYIIFIYQDEEWFYGVKGQRVKGKANPR